MTPNVNTLEAVDARIADAQDLRAALEAELQVIDRAIAADLRGDVAALVERRNTVTAKLGALPVALGDLQTTRAAADRAQALADYEQAKARAYATYKAMADYDAQLQANAAERERLTRERSAVEENLQRSHLWDAAARIRAFGESEMTRKMSDIDRRYRVPGYL